MQSKYFCCYEIKCKQDIVFIHGINYKQSMRERQKITLGNILNVWYILYTITIERLSLSVARAVNNRAILKF